MKTIGQLNNFLERLSTDDRITAWHVSLCMAMIGFWLQNGCADSFSINRRTLMKASHIKSFENYHRCIGDLQRLDFITYRPSYHPQNGSLISILI